MWEPQGVELQGVELQGKELQGVCVHNGKAVVVTCRAVEKSWAGHD